MLVITRRPAEHIRIAGSIEITVLSVRNGVAKIGITAPKDVKILRSELTPNETPTKEEQEQ